MAIRIFPWGTVKDTPSGVLFSISRGLKFELSYLSVNGVAGYIEGNGWGRRIYGRASVAYSTGPQIFDTIPTSAGLYMAWDPPLVPPTAKSVLKVGRGARLAVGWGQVAGTTPTILNRDEAMELADALRAAKSSQAAKVAQTTP